MTDIASELIKLTQKFLEIKRSDLDAEYKNKAYRDIYRKALKMKPLIYTQKGQQRQRLPADTGLLYTKLVRFLEKAYPDVERQSSKPQKTTRPVLTPNAEAFSKFVRQDIALSRSAPRQAHTPTWAAWAKSFIPSLKSQPQQQWQQVNMPTFKPDDPEYFIKLRQQLKRLTQELENQQWQKVSPPALSIK
jgi:hypothetical protein